MKDKKTAMTLILTVVIAVGAYAQQYDSESDFKVNREGNGITITKYIGTKTEVRIPPRIQNLPVTGIGERAFEKCFKLTSVTIPNSVTSIGSAAFQDCFSLTSITIPNSVTSIGSSAFNGCSSLASVTIPNSVTSIGNGAFFYCTSLTSVTIPNSVTSIGRSAFENCTSLTSVTIGNGVASIGEWAFGGCSKLTNVTFQGTIPSIGFYNDDTYPSFNGDLRDKFYATDKNKGTPGTYRTLSPVGSGSKWIKQ